MLLISITFLHFFRIKISKIHISLPCGEVFILLAFSFFHINYITEALTLAFVKPNYCHCIINFYLKEKLAFIDGLPYLWVFWCINIIRPGFIDLICIIICFVSWNFLCIYILNTRKLSLLIVHLSFNIYRINRYLLIVF